MFLAAAKVGGILANNTLSGRVHPRQPRDPDQRDPRGLARGRASGCCSSARRASTRATARSRSARTTCSPGRSSPPTAPTRSPRSPASRCAGRTTASTARSTSARCRPTSTAPATTTTCTTSHVLPALIRRFHEAKARGDKTVTLWGTGTPRREFLYSDDMAAACVHLMELPPDRLATIVNDRDAAARQRRLRRGSHDPRARRARAQDRRRRRRDRVGSHRSRTARRANCSTSASCRRSAGGRRSDWTTAFGARTPTICARPIGLGALLTALLRGERATWPFPGDVSAVSRFLWWRAVTACFRCSATVRGFGRFRRLAGRAHRRVPPKHAASGGNRARSPRGARAVCSRP